MRTLTVKFVVVDEEAESGLINEIAEVIGDCYGVPFVASDTKESTKEEIEVYEEMIE